MVNMRQHVHVLAWLATGTRVLSWSSTPGLTLTQSGSRQHVLKALDSSAPVETSSTTAQGASSDLEGAAELRLQLESAWREALAYGARKANRRPNIYGRVADAGAGDDPALAAKSDSIPTMLRQLLSPGCRWDGDSESVGGAAVIEERVQGFGNFFEDATFAVTGCTFADRADADAADGNENGWPNPFGKKDDEKAGAVVATGASSLETFTATWTFSGTWPLPWRPRARVSGTCEVVTELVAATSSSSSGSKGLRRQITGLFDTWVAPGGGTLGLLMSQVVPRTIDVLNVYSSPHAEKVPYKVLERRNGYDLVETVPQAVIEVGLVLDSSDPSDAERLIGSFLPEHAFAEALPFRGKYGDEYVTISPLSVSVESLPPTSSSSAAAAAATSLGAPSVRRITWTIPIPSMLCPGLDPWECLPPLPSQDVLNTEAAQEANDNLEAEAEEEDGGIYAAAAKTAGVGGQLPPGGANSPVPASSASFPSLPLQGLYDAALHGPKWTCQYGVQPARKLAVAPFGLADTATDEAAAARRALLEAMAKDGLKPTKSSASGKPKFELLQHSTKLGWSPKTKRLHLGIYPATPSWFPKPHAVAAEVSEA